MQFIGVQTGGSCPSADNYHGRVIMKETTLIIALTFPATLGLAPGLRAATITIGASRDGTIYFNHTDRGSGGGNALISGTNGQDDPRRALIAFDIAGHVPAGAKIRRATMSLVLGALPTEPSAMSLIETHRILADWGEGTTQQQAPANDSLGGTGQGAPAANGDVTWSSRFWGGSPIPWNTPGGDFAASASSAAAVGQAIDVRYTWPSTAATVGDVQNWLDDPAMNFGWMLVNGDESSMSTFRVFFSRHVATAMLRPELTVDYVPEPTGGCTIAMACGALLPMFRRIV
jgi:hypothetical protein